MKPLRLWSGTRFARRFFASIGLMCPFMETSKDSPLQEDQLTLFAVDSLAKTSAQQESRQVSRRAQGLVSFTNSCESFAWFSPNTSSWKTSQRSLLTDWTPFLGNWPRQGLMRNGHVFQQVLWEPATKGIDGGSLPTPRANSAMTVNLRTQQNRPELQRNLETVIARMLPTPVAAALLPTPVARDWKGPGKVGQLPTLLTPPGSGMYLNPSFVEEMMGFPVGWTDLKQ